MLCVVDRARYGAYPQSVFPHGFWDSPIWKQATQGGMREISKMVKSGMIVGAPTQGAPKTTSMVSALKPTPPSTATLQPPKPMSTATKPVVPKKPVQEVDPGQ